MPVRRLAAAVAVAAGALAVSSFPSSAAGAVTDLYVATPDQAGDDAHDCSPDAPCATVQRALDLAADTGTTIHVGPGTFDGVVAPRGKSVAVEGTATQTELVSTDETAYDVVEVDSGELTLSNLAVSGGVAVDVIVYGTGVFHGRHLTLTDTLSCGLGVLAGSADLTDSIVQQARGGCSAEAGSQSDGEVSISGGMLSLVRTQILDPVAGRPGLTVTGGDVAVDQSYFDDSTNDVDTNGSDGVWARGGSVAISRSAFHGFGGSGVHVDGATTFLSDDTFQGNVVGVTGDSGSTTVVRSTFEGELAALQGTTESTNESTTESTVAVAGSVLGPDSIENCGPESVTDLGYNLSADDSCGFTAGTSQENVDDLHLDTGLTAEGGPSFLPTVAIVWPSSAVDHIPVGATYGDPAAPLCPQSGSTDLRGVLRPVGGACDAGSMELTGTEPSIKAPRKVTVRVGERVHITLRASGSPRPVVRKVAGHLPRGLTFHRGTGTASVTGRPKAAAVGTHHVRVRAVNFVGQDGHRLTLVVRRR